MNILKAIEDINLFRPYLSERGEALDTWANWLTFLKVLYGLPVSEDEHELIHACTGRDPAKLPADGFSECLLLCGRRSGKSKVIALVGAYESVLAGRERSVSKGEIPLVAVVSPTRNQSRIIHTYMEGVFDGAPILQREVAEEKREGFVLRNGVEVSIATGDPRTIRGFSVIAAIVDEIAMFGLSEESKVRSDVELVRSLRPALGTTGGRLLCVGSPYKASGYAYQTFKRHHGNDDSDILVWNAASTVMNPSLPARVVAKAVEEDPAAANVEYCTSPGLFREDIEAFVSRELVESLVVPGRHELPHYPGIEYSAFADVSGGRSDEAALAIGHKRGRVVIIDFLGRWKSPHDPYEVVGEMATVIRRYGLDSCSGDQYAAEWTKVAFRGRGIKYGRKTKDEFSPTSWTGVTKSKSKLYMELLPRMTSGEVELIDNDVMVTQLAALQRRTRSGGNDTIDHPPGGHDDLANAIAGVCDAVQQTKFIIGRSGHVNMPGQAKPGSFDELFQSIKARHDQEMERLENGDNGQREFLKALAQHLYSNH